MAKARELVNRQDGAECADSASPSGEAEARLAQKPVTSGIHERANPNRPLTDEQKESDRQKPRIRAQRTHLWLYMSQSKKGFYLRHIGRRHNATAIGLINLIDNLARYEQTVRLKLLPRTAA